MLFLCDTQIITASCFKFAAPLARVLKGTDGNTVIRMHTINVFICFCLRLFATSVRNIVSTCPKCVYFTIFDLQFAIY